MIFTCIVVSVILGMVPVPLIGPSLAFLFFCWVDSYYCFEFIWIARGFPLARRVRHIEERWAYYLAFGLPPAALCTWRSSLANAAVFALIFPSYIIMATRARPLPLDPYNPIPNDSSSTSDVSRYPSPFIPLRLPIFRLIIWLNDSIVRILSVGTGGKTGGGSYYQGAVVTSSSNAVNGSMRKRKGSLDGIENIEEGASYSSKGAADTLASRAVEDAPGRRRMKLGEKKLR